jgi:amidase
MRFLLGMGTTVDAAELEDIGSLAANFKGQVDAALKGVDALLCPVMTDPVASLVAMNNRPPNPDAMARSMTYTAPFNYSGHPCLTLPAGFLSGAPSGYQLIGAHSQEDQLFRIAALHEEISGWAADSP